MDDSIPDNDKQKLRLARNTFLSQLLKRTNSQPQSVRYEDTIAPFEPSDNPILSSKRLKASDILSEDSAMASYSNPFSKGPKQTPLIIRFYDPEIKAKDAHGRTLEDLLRWNDIQLERSHDYIQTVFPLPEGSMFSYSAPIINREVMEAFRSRPELRHRLGLAFTRMLNFYGFEVSAEPEEEEADDLEQAEAAAEAEDEEDIGGKGKAKNEGTKATDRVNEEDGNNPIEHHTEDQTSSTAATTSISTSDTAVDKPAAAEASTSAEIAPQAPSKPLMGYYVVPGSNWQQAFRNWAVRMDHNHLRITRILRCLRVLGLQKECEAFYTALKRVFNDPIINISERSMMYWRRAVRQPLHIAPDGERVPWLKKLEYEQEQQDQTAEMKGESNTAGEAKP